MNRVEQKRLFLIGGGVVSGMVDGIFPLRNISPRSVGLAGAHLFCFFFVVVLFLSTGQGEKPSCCVFQLHSVGQFGVCVGG